MDVQTLFSAAMCSEFLICLFTSTARYPMASQMPPDFATVKQSWPQSAADQHALLLSIHPREWNTGRVLRDSISTGGYWLLARTNAAMPYGQRWFHIWQHPQREELLVIKEPGPTNPLMVRCSLEAAPPNGIHATFQLLSGDSFAAYTFTALAPYFPLLLKDLQEEAEYQAAGRRLLETHKRSVQILMPGFHTLLPECLPIWQEATITEAELQTHLSHLQSLSLAELRALAANFED